VTAVPPERIMPRPLACLVLFAAAAVASAALPTRKPEHTDALVEKVVEPTEAETKDGVLVTVFLKGRKAGVVVRKDTPIHLQMGKLVPTAEAKDIKVDSKVSVWVDAKTDVAEGVLIFK
jgi:hypothetical protein